MSPIKNRAEIVEYLQTHLKVSIKELADLLLDNSELFQIFKNEVINLLKEEGFTPGNSVIHHYIDREENLVSGRQRVWTKQARTSEQKAVDSKEDFELSEALTERRTANTQRLEKRELTKAHDLILSLQDELEFYKGVDSSVKEKLILEVPTRYQPVQVKGLIDAYTMLSDVHPGKLITLEQTLGVNEFNPDIAQERLNYYWINLIELLHRQRLTDSIDVVNVVFGGDMIENRYMHPGEATEASMSANEEVLFMFKSCRDGLESILSSMKDHCNKIRVTGICGNHDRMPNHRRTPHNNRTRESLAYLMYQMLSEHFRDEPFIEWIIPEGEGAILDSFGYQTLFVHGDNVKVSKANGMIAPSRDYMEKKIKAHGLDHLRFGHWHNYFSTPKFGINGCFKAGTLVKLADGGYKEIENIQAGDKVITKGETAESVLKVIPQAPTEDWMVRITPNLNEKRTITCTPNHEFWGKKGMHLTRGLGQKRVKPNIPPKDLEGEWIEARHLSVGDYLKLATVKLPQIKK